MQFAAAESRTKFFSYTKTLSDIDYFYKLRKEAKGTLSGELGTSKIMNGIFIAVVYVIVARYCKSFSGEKRKKGSFV